MTKYIPCSLESIPDGVRFDVPRRNQGHGTADEVAYGGFSRGEHDDGDLYKRVRTATEAIRGEGGRYYKLANEVK